MTTKILPNVNALEKEAVQSTVSTYLNFHDDSKKDNKDQRKTHYAEMVNSYYDLATDFYEWGWGHSFHFAVRHKQEGFHAALARHEHYLALKLGMNSGHEVLDVGCGVGGPARNIARLTRGKVVGLNNNQYQVDRANRHTRMQGLEGQVTFVKGDFMHTPFENDRFDGVYQIEATAHAPDKVACYKELLRVLKPGQLFASYEWCLTDKFDPNNKQHLIIKKGIEEGDGLPDIATTKEVLKALEEAGFEVLESKDIAEEAREGYEYPWYYELVPIYTNPLHWNHTRIGKFVMSKVLTVLEMVGIAPKGTVGVSSFLNTAAANLVAGGETGIFTAMFFTLARKPHRKSDA